MKKIVSLIAMLFMLLSPVLTSSVYAESHAKGAETSEDAKKKVVEEEIIVEEDEEPECD